MRIGVALAPLPPEAAHKKGDVVYQRGMVIHTRGRSCAVGAPSATSSEPHYVFVDGRAVGGMGTISSSGIGTVRTLAGRPPVGRAVLSTRVREETILQTSG